MDFNEHGDEPLIPFTPATDGRKLDFALTDRPKFETDASAADKAGTIADTLFDVYTRAKDPVDPDMDDGDARAEATYMSHALTGSEDVHGRIWNGGRPFANGREFLRKMRDFVNRDPDERYSRRYREYMAKDAAGRLAEAMEARSALDRIKHGIGDAAAAVRDAYVENGVPTANPAFYGPAAYATPPDGAKEENDARRERDRKDYERQVLRDYELGLARENAWSDLASILALPDSELSAGAKECVRAVVASEDVRLPETLWAKFNALPDAEKHVVCRTRRIMRADPDGDAVNFLKDLSVGALNVGTAIATAPYRFGNKIGQMAFMSDYGVDVNELSRRRQMLWEATGDFFAGGAGGGHLPQMQLEQTCNRHGFVAEALIGAVSTLPYMGAAALPGIGTPLVALEAMNEMDDHVALEGGDISDPAYIGVNAVLGGLYAYTERLQLEGLLGGVGDLEVRTALLKGLWKGALSKEAVRNTLAGTVAESVQEGLQNGIMEVNEALALDGDATRAFAEGFTSDFIGSLGTMLVVEAGGHVVGHAKRSGYLGGGNNVFTSAGREAGREARSMDVVRLADSMAALQDMVNPEARGDAERTREINDFYKAWKDGGARALRRRFGLSEEGASEVDGFFKAQREAEGAATAADEAVPRAMGDGGGKTLRAAYGEFLSGRSDGAALRASLKKLGFTEKGADDYVLFAQLEKDVADRGRAVGRFLAGRYDRARATGEEKAKSLARVAGAMEDLDPLRRIWANGKGVYLTDKSGKAVADPGARALEAHGFTKDAAERLSRVFHHERAAACSRVALDGVKALYEARMRGRVDAAAALRDRFGGRMVRLRNGVDGKGEATFGDYLAFKAKDGSTKLVQIVESDAGAPDFAAPTLALGRSIADVLNANGWADAHGGRAFDPQADWVDRSPEERRRIWERHGLSQEGFYTPVPHVTMAVPGGSAVDSAQAAELIGRVTVAGRSAGPLKAADGGLTGLQQIVDTSAVFHEVFHAFSDFAKQTGIFNEEDLENLRARYGNPTVAGESYDEETGSEGFRAYLSRRMEGAASEEDETSPWRKLAAFVFNLKKQGEEKAAREAARRTAEERFYDQIVADAMQRVGSLAEEEEKPAPEAGEPPPPPAAAADSRPPPAAPVSPADSASPAPAPAPAAPAPAAPKTWSAFTPTGNARVSGHWQVFDLSELVHSNNPLYARYMRAQLRDRKDNKAEEDTRNEIVNNFQAERLLEAPDTANGAPIVFMAPDEAGTVRPFVLSGNGRVLVLNELAARHLFDQYRDTMKRWAAANGVRVPDGDTPVLVRVIDDYGGETRDRIADLSNTNSIQQYNEEEQARADAEVVRANNLARLYVANQDGTPNMTGANDEFFAEFVRGVGDTSLYTSDRTLTQKAVQRATRALMAIAAGQGTRGRDVVKKLVEQTATLGISRQKNAVVMMAAPVAALEGKPEYAIGPDVSRAVADFMDYVERKAKGVVGTIGDVLAEGDMFDPRSEIADEILKLLASNRAAATIAEYVKEYCKAAGQEDPAGNLFGAARTRTEIWHAAAKLVDERADASDQAAARHSVRVNPNLREDAEAARREYDEVVARYTNPDGTRRAGWMRAPNGKPTNLTERQWAQVRTPSFKKWFGDWEAAATLSAIERMTSVEIKDLADGFDTKAAYSALANGKNALDGREVRFVNATLGKILRHRGYDTARLVPRLKEVFDAAIPLGFETERTMPARGDGTPHKEHRNFVGYHSYLGKITDGGRTYFVRFTVQELKTRSKSFIPNELHSTFVSDVELYNEADLLALDTAKGAGKVGAVGLIDGMLAKSLSEFKRARDGSSKVVDENGEPKVVYHGTSDVFTEFKPEEMRAREGSFFFAENREDAMSYSGNGNVMPVYVNLRNPFDYERGSVPDTYRERWRKAETKREQVAILKELGYDGWLADFENGNGWGEVSCFYPEQVKSATDNVGAFSQNNPDIRFSIRVNPNLREDAEAARREYDEVVARYTNPDGTRRAGWMKAPNGKPTNLTERQWAQVRTPSFKKWFGDWESMAELAPSNIPEAKAVFKGLMARNAEIKTEDGVTLRFVSQSAKAFSKEAEKSSSSANAHWCALTNIENLVGRSRFLYEEKPRNGSQDIEAYVKYGAAFSFGGEQYLAKITSKRYAGRDAQNLYSVESVSVEKIAARGIHEAIAKGQPLDTDSTQRIADFLGRINPSSVSKVVDENGEPKVVYHGSEKRFTEFSNKFFGSHTDTGHGGVGVWGRGHYFSDKEYVADDYRRGNPDGQTISTYLNIRNPIPKEEILRMGKEASDSIEDDYKGFYLEYQRLIDGGIRENGYDGVIVKVGHSTEYVVFSPEQVKSATDNVGAFSQENPDIRFSVATTARAALNDIAEGKAFGVIRNAAFGDIQYHLGRLGRRGMGLAHIVESRMSKDGDTLDMAVDVAIRVAEAAEDGVVTAERYNTKHFDKNGVRAIVAFNGDGNKVITGYEISADVTGGANRRSPETRPHPHVSLEEVVAALKRKLEKAANLKLRGEAKSSFESFSGGGLIKTPEDISSFVSAESIPQSDAERGTRFAIRVNPKLREDVEAALAKRSDAAGVRQMKRHAEIVFSEDLPMFEFLGLPSRRVVSDATRIRKLAAKHHLDEAQIADLPKRCDSPAAVMRDGADGYVVLTDMLAETDDGERKPVRVFLRPKTWRSGEVVFLATAMAENGADERAYYEPLVKSGLLYADQGKIAGLMLGEETESILRTQASGDGVKTAEEYSAWASRSESIPQSGAERTAESVARNSIRAALADGGEGEAERALANYVAYFKLSHGGTPARKTLARMGLAMGMKTVMPDRIVKSGRDMAERVRGTLIEQAARNGDVAAALALMRRENAVDQALDDLVAGGAAAGGTFTHKGVGRVNDIIHRRVETMMKSFTAASLADMEGETGLDIASEILANDPDAFDPKPQKPNADPSATADEDEEGGGGADGEDGDVDGERPLSDREKWERERRRMEAEKKVRKFIEEAKKRAEERRLEAEERRRRAEERRAQGLEPETGGEGGGSDFDPVSAELEGAKEDAPKGTVLADFRSPSEFAAFLRVWAADRFARQHGHTSLAKAQQDRLFAEFYRICARKELGDLADKLLAPRGARAFVNRRLQDLEKGVRPDTVERISAAVFAFINKAAIRESRDALVKKFKKDLRKRYLKGAKFDQMKQDADRKVTGWVEESVRYICRVCDLSRRALNGNPSAYEKERAKLLERINRREEVYDDAGMKIADAATADMETVHAMAKLALLDKYGAMTSLMPGQILNLQDEAFRYFEDEARKLEDRWRETRERQEAIRIALAAAIVAPKGQRYQEKGWLNGRLFDALNGLIRLRLVHLTRFASDEARRKAENAINDVIVMLGDGETAYARAIQSDRTAFFAGLAQIFQKSDGGADNAAIRKYLERMDEAIPEDLSRQLSKQGFVGTMTYGQMLQLLVSLEQGSFKDAVKANGRDGQAALIRGYRTVDGSGNAVNVFTREDGQFVDWLRAFYERKRGAISQVTMRMVGHEVLSPDPLYCPVRRSMDDRARGLHSDPTPRWDPISKAFSRRVKNLRDFDESRSIVGMFFESSEESAKLVAWAERGTIIRNVFTHAGVQNAIRRAFGAGELGNILKQLEATFNGGKSRSTTPGEIAAADKAMNFITYSYLAFNPLSAMKQTTGFTVWANVLPNGFRDLWRHMTHVDRDVVRHIMESEQYKIRYGDEVGSGQDLATKGLYENPSTNPLVRAVSGAGMKMLKWGDLAPSVWIAQGVYKDLLDRYMAGGMDYDAADRRAMTETFNLLEETQQSGRTYNTNRMAIEHGRIARLLTQFATSPLQQLQFETQAWREWRDMVRYEMGEKKIAAARQKFWRAALINHILLPAALELVISAYKLAMGEEPPWEKKGAHWDFLTEILLGQFSSVFFLGALTQTTLTALFKREQSFRGILPVEGAIGTLSSAAFLMHDLVAMDADNVRKDLERAIKSTAPTRIPYNMARRVLGDSDVDRKRRKEKRK